MKCLEAEIVSGPSDRRPTVGENLALDCKAKGYPIPTIAWIFNARDGTIMQLPKAEIVSGPSDRRLNVGEPLALDCEAKGYPIPTNAWTFNARDGTIMQLPSELELVAENNNDDSSHDMETRRVIPEPDRLLPIANVTTIMKKAIPESARIRKDAKELVQECASEFISFITSEASERCRVQNRHILTSEDILHAMSTLGFDNYIEPLKNYLTKYKEATQPRTEE